MGLKDDSGEKAKYGRAKRCEPDGGNLLSKIGTIEVLTAVLTLIAAVQFMGYISSERAVVYADAVTLPGGLGGIDPLPMRLEIRNGGKSVATIKEVAAAISHTLPAERGNMKFTEFPFPPVVPTGVVKRTLPFPVTGGYKGETLTKLKDSTLKLYLFGVIRYSDWANFPLVFGYKETGFCYAYYPIRGEDGFETCNNPAYSYAN